SVRACADRGRLCACQFAAAGADRSRRAVDGMGRRARAVGLRAADAARAPSGLAMTTRGTPTDDGAVVESGPPPPGGFDRVARIYHALERLAFGRALERARFAHLPALAGCRDVLVLGDGDGRCVAHLASMLPEAHIRCVDGSAGMLARLQARIVPADRARISCEQADIRTVALPARSADAVLTMFVLDCLTDEEVARLAPRVAAALRPGGRWLFADFSIP